MMGLLGPWGLLGLREAHVPVVVTLRDELQRQNLELAAEGACDGPRRLEDLRLRQAPVQHPLLLGDLPHVHLTMLAIIVAMTRYSSQTSIGEL